MHLLMLNLVIWNFQTYCEGMNLMLIHNVCVFFLAVSTRLYQILVTFSNFSGTLPKIVVQLAIHYAPNSFCLNFHFTPPQSTFPLRRAKNRKNSHNSTTTWARVKFFFQKMQNTKFLSVVNTLFRPICSIFQVKWKKHAFHCFSINFPVW